MKVACPNCQQPYDIHDFDDVYDFNEAFVKPFAPEERPTA